MLAHTLLTHITQSPYFLTANLPVPHPLPSDNLLVAWESHHFLAALMLKTVESYITSQERPVRTRAIMLLVSVMAQHELDARCSNPQLRDRVGLLYVPPPWLLPASSVLCHCLSVWYVSLSGHDQCVATFYEAFCCVCIHES